jgi:hypothetical protein
MMKKKKKKTPKAEMGIKQKQVFCWWRFGIFLLYEKRAKLLEEFPKKEKKELFSLSSLFRKTTTAGVL